MTYEETFEEFWRELVCNPDGSLNVDAVKRELHDYRFLMRNTAEAFDAVTGGRISKPNTMAFEVESVVEERIQERAEELAKELRSGVPTDQPRWDGTVVTLEELLAKIHATETLVFFHCEKCGGFTVAVQRDVGILPMVIACRASGSSADCDGRSVIRRRPPEDVPRTPAWELFNPHADRSVPSDENAAVASVLDVLGIRSLKLTCRRGCHTMTTNAPDSNARLNDVLHLEAICAEGRARDSAGIKGGEVG
jgi:hypothetical protein